MRKSCRVVVVVVALLACFAATNVLADWSPNGTKLTLPCPDQNAPVLAADSRGGTFVAFTQGRSAGIQHLTASGELAAGWPAAGIAVDAGVPFYLHGNYRASAVASDGQGGVYLACFEQGPHCGNECYFEPFQLYLHRLGANGLPAPGWTTEGIRLDPLFISFGYVETHLPSLVSDGHGGALIAWASASYFVPFQRVLVQSVSARGELRWGDSGVELARTVGDLSSPVVLADAHKGAFVCWAQSDTGVAASFVRGQHVNAAGEPEWSDAATRLAAIGGPRVLPPVAVPNGSQGAIIAWSSATAGRTFVYAKAVGFSGSARWQRQVAECAAVRGQVGVAGTSIDGGGAILAWVDHVGFDSTIVMAQRLSRDGRLQWGSGALLCAADRGRGPAVIAPDGHDGAFIAWGDSRSTGELFATRVTRGGALAQGWAPNGDVVSHWDSSFTIADYGPGSFGPLRIVPTDNGTAVLAWQDTRSFNGNLLDQCYAMALTPSGPASVHGAKRRVSRLFSDAPQALRTPTAALSLAPISPNPGRTGQVLRFTLAEDGAASIALVDVAGRRIWSREMAGLGRGKHELRLAPDVWIPAGIYFVRLTQGERVATTRVTILR